MSDNLDDGSAGTLISVVHPASRRPVKTALVLMVIGMIIGGIYQVTGEVIFCAVAAGVFMVTLAPYFLKTTTILDDRGVTQKRLGSQRFISWNSLRRAEPSPTGIYLSTKRAVSWMDFRGIHILFGNDREVVVDRIREKMAQLYSVAAPRV